MITILQLAEHRGAQADEEGHIEGEEFYRVGLDFMGGCRGCEATIAAYNAYPSRSGFWCCADCIGESGWETVEEANQAMFSVA